MLGNDGDYRDMLRDQYYLEGTVEGHVLARIVISRMILQKKRKYLKLKKTGADEGILETTRKEYEFCLSTILNNGFYFWAYNFTQKYESVSREKLMIMMLKESEYWPWTNYAENNIYGCIRNMDTICQLLRKGYDSYQIACEIKQKKDYEFVKRVCDIAQPYAPDYEVEDVLDAVLKDEAYSYI